jgi:hypothetical protein
MYLFFCCIKFVLYKPAKNILHKLNCLHDERFLHAGCKEILTIRVMQVIKEQVVFNLKYEA